MPSGHGGKCLWLHSSNAACILLEGIYSKGPDWELMPYKVRKDIIVARGIELYTISLNLKFNLYSSF